MSWETNRAPFDQNRTPTLVGVSKDYTPVPGAHPDTVVPIAVDPTNGAMLVETVSGESVSNVSQIAATNPAPTTMQSAATATGVGTPMVVSGYAEAIVEVSGTFVGTITLQASADGTNFDSGMLTYALGSGTATSLTITASGIYRIKTVGLSKVQANITAYTSGSITVKGYPAVMGSANEPVTDSSGRILVNPGASAASTDSISTAIAENVLPTSSSNGTNIPSLSDKFGRTVTLPQGFRDIIGQKSTTITASTASTSVLPAAGSTIFTDISSIVLANSGASSTLATLSDGTNSYYFYVPAGDARGAAYQVPLPATTVNTAWTVTCGTSTSSLYVTIVYIKNQ